MIRGVIQADAGRIRLKVRGPGGRARQIEAIVDTGYTASLALPPSSIISLGLRWRSLDRGMLADGREYLIDVYEGKVLWDGKVCEILIDEVEAEPLVGMGLLSGYELNMKVRPGGMVTIKRLR